MNANKDKLDSLTERVLGAVFEVTNTLGAGFLDRESLPASAAQRTRPSRHPGYRRSFIYSHLQESLCRRILCRSARRRRVGGRAEMCGTALQRAHSAVSQLSASLRPDRLSSRQFPEALRSSGSVSSIGFRISKPIEAPVGAESTQLGCPSISWTLH